jgi:hypothetical protein
MSGDGLPWDEARRLLAAGDQQPERISKFPGVDQDRRTHARKLGAALAKSGAFTANIGGIDRA